MNYLWVVEYRPKPTHGHKWRPTDTSALRKSNAQSVCKKLNLAWKNNEFRVVKYQRVEGE